MTEYKRFTIQILCTADSENALTLHAAIEKALNGIAKCHVKAVNFDMWADGYTGDPRKFDQNGVEIREVAQTNTLDAVDPNAV